MWPWEHAAVGYLLWSLGLRALGREPPSDREALLVLAATQLPDLVDKPLSWGLGWFPSGYAVGHAAVVALPVGIAALALGVRYDRRRWAAAAVVGYWTHLLGDVLNPVRGGSRPLVVRVLWPLVDTAPYDVDYGLARGVVYLRDLLETLQTTDPLGALLGYVLLPASVVALWLVDGAPGVAWVFRAVARVRRR